VKSPIEYFEEQVFEACPDCLELSAAELRFLQKYVGLDYDVATILPTPSQIVEVPSLDEPLLQTLSESKQEAKGNKAWDSYLQETAQSLLMGFRLDGDVYALPALAVEEVIHDVRPVVLPMKSDAVLGVITFRSRVTPLICISRLLKGHGPSCSDKLAPKKLALEKLASDKPVAEDKDSKNLLVICHCQGLQFGLLIECVEAMYTVSREALLWDLAATLGVDTTYIAALCVKESRIIPVLSLDNIVASILQ